MNLIARVSHLLARFTVNACGHTYVCVCIYSLVCLCMCVSTWLYICVCVCVGLVRPLSCSL